MISIKRVGSIELRQSESGTIEIVKWEPNSWYSAKGVLDESGEYLILSSNTRIHLSVAQSPEHCYTICYVRDGKINHVRHGKTFAVYDLSENELADYESVIECMKASYPNIAYKDPPYRSIDDILNKTIHAMYIDGSARDLIIAFDMLSEKYSIVDLTSGRIESRKFDTAEDAIDDVIYDKMLSQFMILK